MAEYRFTAECTISVGLTVEAETLEEAVQKMRNADMRSLCYQCGGATDEEWSASELDGTPRLIEAEDEDGNDITDDVMDLERGDKP